MNETPGNKETREPSRIILARRIVAAVKQREANPLRWDAEDARVAQLVIDDWERETTKPTT